MTGRQPVGARRVVAVALALLLTGAALPSPAHAADSPAVRRLVDKARWWSKRGRGDKAAEVWKKVLRSNPSHPAALTGLGVQAARSGRRGEAKSLLARLRKAHPAHPGIDTIARMLRLGNRYDKTLQEARRLVRAGRKAEAIARYRAAFAGEAPTGAVALEFYQTLGGTKGGWNEARVGLERLMKRSRGRADIKLAWARHLTYRAATRRRGIGALLELAGHPIAGGDALRSARKALMWLKIKPSDRDLFERYTARAGPDPELMAHLERGTPKPGPAPRVDRVREGFKALKSEDVDRADRIFKRAARVDGKGPQILVGLAVVALQRGEFKRARELLEKVKRFAPKRPELWERSLRSARFWEAVSDAEAQRKAGKPREAERLLLEAVQISPDEAHHARLALANLYARTERSAEAEVLYRALVKRDPRDAAALRGLVDLLVSTGRTEAAIAANRKLRQLDPKRALDEGRLRSELLQRQGDAARKGGDLAQAAALYREALAAHGKNHWARLSLVYTLLSLGQLPLAQTEAQRLVGQRPELVEAKVALARVLVGRGRHAAAMDTLGQVPADKLTPEARLLRRRIDVELGARRALARAVRGERLAARHTLMRLERNVADQPPLMAVIALAWADLGEIDRALRVMHEAISRTPKSGVGMRLQLASILLRANRDAEFLTTVNEIGASDTLDTRQRRDLDALRTAYAIRRCDAMREAGQYDRALGFISPLLREHPNDGGLLAALARLFFAAGEFSRAQAIYTRILSRKPLDLPARHGAVQTAVAMHRPKVADGLVREGLRRMPNHPRMHFIAGRFHLLVGDDARAMASFRRALALVERQVLTGARKLTRKGFIGARQRDPSRLAGSTGELLRAAESRFGARDTSDPTVGRQQLGLQGEIRAEIDRIEERYHIDLTSDVEVRRRNGEAGLSLLTELRVPVRLQVPIGYAGYLGFAAIPTMLDASTARLSDVGVSDRYGSTSAAPSALALKDLPLTASGASLGVSYRSKGWVGHLGSTPLGFPVQNVVGGLTWRGTFGALGVHLDLHRAPVTDSVLSYAGMADPRTGKIWGGVLRQGGRADLAWSGNDAVYYVWSELDALTGEGVATNTRFAGGLGVEWKLHDWEGKSFVMGLSGTLLSYGDNLRYFTLGQGGYFSPQVFLHLGVPFIWRGTQGKLRWELRGKAGINWFSEDATDWYPTDDALQAQRLAALDADGAPLAAQHAAYSSLAFAIDAVGRLAYRLSQRLEAGLHLRLHSADDFQEFTGALYLRFDFQAKTGGEAPALRAAPF